MSQVEQALSGLLATKTWLEMRAQGIRSSISDWLQTAYTNEVGSPVIRLGRLRVEGLKGLILRAPLHIHDVGGVGFILNDSNEEEINNWMQSICLQIVEKVGVEYVDISIIDPKKLGRSFKIINRLQPGNVKLYKNTGEINKEVEEQISSVTKIIQNELQQYDDIYEFSQDNNTPIRFRILLISNFPHGFKSSIDNLRALIRNASECGVLILFSIDENEPLPYDVKGIDYGSLFENGIIFREVGDPNEDHYEIAFGRSDYRSLYNDSGHLELDKRILNKSKLIEQVDRINAKSKEDFTPSLTDIFLPVGKYGGDTVHINLGETSGGFSAIIGGQPGSGKSVLLKTIITEGILNYNESELVFFIGDCAGVEYNLFSSHPQVVELLPAADKESREILLSSIQSEFDRRIGILQNSQSSNITIHNSKASDPLPKMIILIDEFHLLFSHGVRMSDSAEKTLLGNVARLGRKFGMYLILATQSLGSDVRRSFLDNTRIRIALQMNESQSTSFLSHRNSAAAKLERYHAIVNHMNGEPLDNKVVKIRYRSDDQIVQAINI